MKRKPRTAESRALQDAQATVGPLVVLSRQYGVKTWGFSYRAAGQIHTVTAMDHDHGRRMRKLKIVEAAVIAMGVPRQSAPELVSVFEFDNRTVTALFDGALERHRASKIGAR